jgi:hypothetical protein
MSTHASINKPKATATVTAPKGRRAASKKAGATKGRPTGQLGSPPMLLSEAKLRAVSAAFTAYDLAFDFEAHQIRDIDKMEKHSHEYTARIDEFCEARFALLEAMNRLVDGRWLKRLLERDVDDGGANFTLVSVVVDGIECSLLYDSYNCELTLAFRNAGQTQRLRRHPRPGAITAPGLRKRL